MTHSYAILTVSAATFQEVADKLRDAGYGHAFDGGRIDMHGIALAVDPNDYEPDDADSFDRHADHVEARADAGQYGDGPCVPGCRHR